MLEQPLTRRAVESLYQQLRERAAEDAERRHQAEIDRLLRRMVPLVLPPDRYTNDATAILAHLSAIYGATLTRAQGSLPALAVGDLTFQMADVTISDLVRVTGPGGRSVLVDGAGDLGSNLDYILHVPPPAAPGSEMDGDDDMPF